MSSMERRGRSPEGRRGSSRREDRNRSRSREGRRGERRSRSNSRRRWGSEESVERRHKRDKTSKHKKHSKKSKKERSRSNYHSTNEEEKAVERDEGDAQVPVDIPHSEERQDIPQPPPPTPEEPLQIVLPPEPVSFEPPPPPAVDKLEHPPLPVELPHVYPPPPGDAIQPSLPADLHAKLPLPDRTSHVAAELPAHLADNSQAPLPPELYPVIHDDSSKAPTEPYAYPSFVDETCQPPVPTDLHPHAVAKSPSGPGISQAPAHAEPSQPLVISQNEDLVPGLVIDHGESSEEEYPQDKSPGLYIPSPVNNTAKDSPRPSPTRSGSREKRRESRHRSNSSDRRKRNSRRSRSRSRRSRSRSRRSRSRSRRSRSRSGPSRSRIDKGLRMLEELSRKHASAEPVEELKPAQPSSANDTSTPEVSGAQNEDNDYMSMAWITENQESKAKRRKLGAATAEATPKPAANMLPQTDPNMAVPVSATTSATEYDAYCQYYAQQYYAQYYAQQQQQYYSQLSDPAYQSFYFGNKDQNR